MPLGRKGMYRIFHFSLLKRVEGRTECAPGPCRAAAARPSRGRREARGAQRTAASPAAWPGVQPGRRRQRPCCPRPRLLRSARPAGRPVLLRMHTVNIQKKSLHRWQLSLEQEGLEQKNEAG